jgi:PleD family two-component response regulator
MTGEAVDAVFPRAGAALYAAKQTGCNRVVCADHILISTLQHTDISIK